MLPTLLLCLSLLSGCMRLGPFPSPPVDYGEVVELPLVQVPDDRRRLYVSVPTESMGEQLWFLDTGYSHTTCDSSAMEALGVQPRDTRMSTRGELGAVPLQKAELPSFALGGHQVHGLRCAVRDLPGTSSIPAGEGYQVTGVLGSNLLRRFVVEVDPAAGLLRLHPPGSVTPRRDLRARRETGVGPRLLVPLQLDGQRSWAVLDYGATGTYLDAERIGLPLLKETTGTWAGTGSSNSERRVLRYHHAQQVSLGGVSAPPIQVVQRPWSPSTPGLVGMNVLGHYHLLIDYRRGWTQLEPITPMKLPVVGEAASAPEQRVD